MVTDRGEERRLEVGEQAFDLLAERFVKNDRVEVLVEYTKNASGVGPSAP
jgi:hypothetical protein